MEKAKIKTNTCLEKERTDAEEFLNILSKVPNKKKERVLGIVEGFAISGSEEKAG